METEISNNPIGEILNCTCESIKKIIPLRTEFLPVRIISQSIQVQFGTILGFTGSHIGNLIFYGEKEVFSKIGEEMFGMPIKGDLLHSFTGELGNILAGNYRR